MRAATDHSGNKQKSLVQSAGKALRRWLATRVALAGLTFEIVPCCPRTPLQSLAISRFSTTVKWERPIRFQPIRMTAF
jgi:hypothetical protein